MQRPTPFHSFAEHALNPAMRQMIERFLVTCALVLFLLHLALYAGNEVFTWNLPESLFGHPLATLYTPFSVILIAEVYLLIYYS